MVSILTLVSLTVLFTLLLLRLEGMLGKSIGSIWYKALTGGKLGRDATFKEFADLIIKNAGKHGDEIKEAWELVGYPFPDSKSEL